MSQAPTIFATDLVNFTRCRHIATLRRLGVQGKPPSEDGDIFIKKGREHEQRFRDSLVNCVDIPKEEKADVKGALTLDAMYQGAEWIYHGWLIDGRFQGEADFLRRIGTPSLTFGEHSYEVVDTKLGLTPKSEHVLQLCHYSDLLGKIQGNLPRQASIISGDLREHPFLVVDFIHYFRNLRDLYLRFLEEAPETAPYPISYCDLCTYQERCYQELKEKGHVALTLGIRRAQVSALEKMHVSTIAELAALDMTGFTRARGLTREGCALLKEQAAAQTSGKIGVRNADLLRQLPPVATGDLFFDMESDPMAVEGGLEYLFGVWVRETGDEDKFMAFWALSQAEEKKALEETIDYFLEFRKRHPAMHIYHYGSYETAHLVDLACRYGTREEELDELLRAEVFVNLHGVVRKALWLPVESLSLKVLEPLFGYHREGEVKAAGSSIVFFEKWLETGDPSLLEAIERYNEADVESTALLCDWLRCFA